MASQLTKYCEIPSLRYPPYSAKKISYLGPLLFKSEKSGNTLLKIFVIGAILAFSYRVRLLFDKFWYFQTIPYINLNTSILLKVYLDFIYSKPYKSNTITFMAGTYEFIGHVFLLFEMVLESVMKCHKCSEILTERLSSV